MYYTSNIIALISNKYFNRFYFYHLFGLVMDFLFSLKCYCNHHLPSRLSWKLTKKRNKETGCLSIQILKRILRIRWPQTISRQQIQEIIGVNRAIDKIQRQRWNWIRHILNEERSTVLQHWSGGQRGRET